MKLHADQSLGMLAMSTLVGNKKPSGQQNKCLPVIPCWPEFILKNKKLIWRWMFLWRHKFTRGLTLIRLLHFVFHKVENA